MHPSVRARRNVAAPQRILRPATKPKVPALPEDRDWSPRVVAWWGRAFSSPMSDEWVESDIDAMYMAAELLETFYDPYVSMDARARVTVQILKILDACGLTPMARSRLKWQIEQGEEASERTTVRRSVKAMNPAVAAVPDPRDARRGC